MEVFTTFEMEVFIACEMEVFGASEVGDFLSDFLLDFLSGLFVLSAGFVTFAAVEVEVEDIRVKVEAAKW